MSIFYRLAAVAALCTVLGSCGLPMAALRTAVNLPQASVEAATRTVQTTAKTVSGAY